MPESLAIDQSETITGNFGTLRYGDLFPTWNPLPDPRRPEFPYHGGLCLSIHRHVPPQPFGRYYVKGDERQAASAGLLKGIPQSEWCLQQPPTETSPHPDSASTTLCIIEGIALEDGRGAQIVKCCLDQDEEQIYVAKIYDPLYYPYRDRDRGSPIDVAWMADKDYSREAAAYEELQKSQAMEVEAKVNFYGVKHGDFAPRNIILVGSDLEKQLPKVMLVDLNKSVVYDAPNCRYERSSTHLPINPQYRHWGSCDPEFVNWAPEPQRSHPLAFKGWLRQRWEGSREFAQKDEGKIRDLDYDEPVEMVPPQEDREPQSASEMVAAAIQAKQDRDAAVRTSKP